VPCLPRQPHSPTPGPPLAWLRIRLAPTERDWLCSKLTSIMAAPCRKCGATKTEPVRPGLRHKLARKLGYELRKCARCRRLRLIHRRARATSDSGAYEELDPVRAPSFHDPDAFHGCPRCGDKQFHRSPRGWFERVLLRRPPMARCSACRYRFPIPQM
jgi:hypothetical protein